MPSPRSSAPQYSVRVLIDYRAYVAILLLVNLFFFTLCLFVFFSGPFGALAITGYAPYILIVLLINSLSFFLRPKGRPEARSIRLFALPALLIFSAIGFVLLALTLMIYLLFWMAR
jgi:hypothetical protein